MGHLKEQQLSEEKQKKISRSQSLERAVGKTRHYKEVGETELNTEKRTVLSGKLTSALREESCFHLHKVNLERVNSSKEG